MGSQERVNIGVGLQQTYVGVQDFVFKLKPMEVQLPLRAQRFAGFSDQVTMVEVLDRLLKADGDEQTNADGGDVDEEVFPSVGGVRNVHV
jgi:hypothetical protein